MVSLLYVDYAILGGVGLRERVGGKTVTVKDAAI